MFCGRKCSARSFQPQSSSLLQWCKLFGHMMSMEGDQSTQGTRSSLIWLVIMLHMSSAIVTEEGGDAHAALSKCFL